MSVYQSNGKKKDHLAKEADSKLNCRIKEEEILQVKEADKLPVVLYMS